MPIIVSLLLAVDEVKSHWKKGQVMRTDSRCGQDFRGISSGAAAAVEDQVVDAREVERWVRRLSEYRRDLGGRLSGADTKRRFAEKEYQGLRQKIALIDGVYAEIADLLSVIPELR